MVPETGDVLSSSKANFLEAFRLGDILVFFDGLPRLGDSGEGRLIPNGFKGGEPSPMDFNVRSTPGTTPVAPGWPGHFDSEPGIVPGGEFKLGLLEDAAATAALAKICCCKNSGDNGVDAGLEVDPFRVN